MKQPEKIIKDVNVYAVQWAISAHSAYLLDIVLVV